MRQDSQYIIENIRKEHPIVDYMRIMGHTPVREYGNRWTFVCPIHKDNDPSFMVYKNDNDIRDYQTYFCWGCLEENEKVWTSSGLKSIKDIAPGDYVIDIYGSEQMVDATRTLNGSLLGISTGSCGIPLKMTPDHTCYYIKAKDMQSYVPYIYKRSQNDITNKQYRFSSSLKERRRSKKYLNKIKFEIGDAENIEVGDFVAVPVIPDKERKIGDFSIKYSNDKGPIVKVSRVVMNERIAWLLGIWLAEGSLYRGGIAFDFNINETEYAHKVAEICRQELGFDSTIRKRVSKNVCEVRCSSTYLENLFREKLGQLCDGKSIPYEFLYWPKNLQKKLVEGYIDGDGNSSRTSSISVGENLSYGIFHLSIQCQMNPYISFRKSYEDKNGIFHKPTWIISYRNRESLNGFYDTIDNVEYFFSNVSEVLQLEKNARVVDISVKNTHSFMTSSFAVHNCKKSGDIIQLKAELEYGGNGGRGKALSDLGKGMSITLDGELDYLVNELNKLNKDTGAQFDGNLFDNISLNISMAGYDGFEEVDFDSKYLDFMEKIYKCLDKYALNKDIDSMDEAYHFLTDEGKLKEFQDNFIHTKEEETLKDG